MYPTGLSPAVAASRPNSDILIGKLDMWGTAPLVSPS
jgi:hypothetical protein